LFRKIYRKYPSPCPKKKAGTRQRFRELKSFRHLRPLLRICLAANPVPVLVSKNTSINLERKQIMRFLPIYFLVSVLLAAPAVLFSQINVPPPPQDTSSKIKVESSVTGEYFLRDGRYLQKLSGKVRLRQENTLIFCDTAIIDGDDARLIGNVLIDQGDSVRVYGDSAFYYGNTRESDLLGEVVLINGRQELFTSRLHYNLDSKVATYTEGGTLSNGKS
jgi:lipopolysaccharide assembly outer membrane protein LptD (OstA)